MTILIVGGGKFGIKAIEYARECNQAAIVIDNNSHCQAINHVNRQFNNFNDFKRVIGELNKDEIWFIKQNVEEINDLLPLIDFSYIIPVIPIHLMVSIITTFFNIHSIDFIPERDYFDGFIRMSDKSLILSTNLEKGVIYLSYAKQNELCPDNCIGPPNFCPHFKREKKITITRYLRNYFKMNDYLEINENDEILITVMLESYQLKPGLGGLLASEVIHILTILNEKLLVISQKPCKLIIGTTCNCHGVINFMTKNNDLLLIKSIDTL